MLDAAATIQDRIVDHFLGPGSELLDNALAGVPWWDIVGSLYPDTDRTAIFLNPPYSVENKMPIEPWVQLAAEAGERGTVVAVLPFSPQTKWWRTYVEGNLYRATEIRQFPFRIKFDPPQDYEGKASGANINTVVAIYKPTSEYEGQPWQSFRRYWTPAEFHDDATDDQPGRAQPEDRPAGEATADQASAVAGPARRSARRNTSQYRESRRRKAADRD